MFYIAFVYRDMEMLRSQLATMLIILQAINNIQEAIVPLLVRFYMNKMTEVKNYIRRKSSLGDFTKMKNQRSFDEDRATCLDYIPEIHPEDTRLEEAAREGEMEVYEETYDDYLEMFIQFGYVVLFSSVYPAAAFWAVFNNILEIRADAFKLCVVYQRPMSKRVKDIGAWQRTFEIVGAMSIMTNCGLLCLNPHLRKHAPEMSQVEWVLFFVFLEHLLLGVRYLLHIAIPEKPEWVRVALAKKNYESRQALKFEVSSLRNSNAVFHSACAFYFRKLRGIGDCSPDGSRQSTVLTASTSIEEINNHHPRTEYSAGQFHLYLSRVAVCIYCLL